MTTTRQSMPARRGGGPSSTINRTTRDGGGRPMIYSICHGLVKETAFVHVFCSRYMHPHCAIGVVEGTFPRARDSKAQRSRTKTRARRELHAMHQEAHTLLQQIKGLGESAGTTAESDTDARVTAAGVRLSRRSTTPIGTVYRSRRITGRREENIGRGCRGATPQQPQADTPCGACGGHIAARQRYDSPVGLFTRSASWKAI